MSDEEKCLKTGMKPIHLRAFIKTEVLVELELRVTKAVEVLDMRPFGAIFSNSLKLAIQASTKPLPLASQRLPDKCDKHLRPRLFHGAVDFAAGFPLFDGLPPVVVFLPSPKGEFQLDPPSVIEIKAKRDEGKSFLLDFFP